MKKVNLLINVFLVIFITSCENKEIKKVVFQPDSVSGKDVIISEAYGNRNYSNLDKLHLLSLSVQDTIDNDSRFLIRFGFASLAETAQIDSAFIYLNAIEPGHFGEKNAFLVKRIEEPWINKEVTWDDQPKTSKDDIITVSAPNDKMQNYKIDVTKFVKNVVSKKYINQGHLFMLSSEEKPYKGIRFCSSNYENEESRPKLEVFYKE